MDGLNLIWIALATFAGSVIAGLLGWWKDGGTWSWKIFAQTLYSGIGAAVTYVLTYYVADAELTVLAIVGAFGWGAGIDSAVNRVVSALTIKTTT